MKGQRMKREGKKGERRRNGKMGRKGERKRKCEKE